MAETSVQSHNVAVKFRGKGAREMPSVSKAQNRFMHAVAEGKVKGVAKSVGEDFVKADHGRKIRKLPKHVKHAARHARESGHAKMRDAVRRGLVSEDAVKRHMIEA